MQLQNLNNFESDRTQRLPGGSGADNVRQWDLRWPQRVLVRLVTLCNVRRIITKTMHSDTYVGEGCSAHPWLASVSVINSETRQTFTGIR